MKLLALLVALVAGQQQNLGWVYVVDDGGADDWNQAQSDVNYMGSNKDDPLFAEVTWSWDDTLYSGANTGDGCTLWDFDKDGDADFSLCATISTDASGAVISLKGPTFYLCKDTDPTTCHIAKVLGQYDDNGKNRSEMYSLPGGAGTKLKSSCTVDFMPDPFSGVGTHIPGGGQQNTTHDSRAICRIYFDEFRDLSGNIMAGDPQLINVCTYPSAEPNSNYKDCVVNPLAGFVVINKWTNTVGDCLLVRKTGLACGGGQTEASCYVYDCKDTPHETWNFTYSQSGAVKARTGIYGWGWSSLVTLNEGTYSVSEGILPSGWIQVGFRCADNQTNALALVISSGQTLVCYFVNYFGNLSTFIATYGNFSAGTANITLTEYTGERTFAPTPVPAPTPPCPPSIDAFFVACSNDDFGATTPCSTNCLAAANTLQTDIQPLSVAAQDACIDQYNAAYQLKFNLTTQFVISDHMSADPPLPLCNNGKPIVVVAANAVCSLTASAFLLLLGLLH